MFWTFSPLEMTKQGWGQNIFSRSWQH